MKKRDWKKRCKLAEEDADRLANALNDAFRTHGYLGMSAEIALVCHDEALIGRDKK